MEEVMEPIREEILLDPEWEAVDALQKIIRTGEGRLPVVNSSALLLGGEVTFLLKRGRDRTHD